MRQRVLRNRGVRDVGTLSLLLACVCPLCCRASWMWMGVTSVGGAEELGCAALPPQQLFLLPAVQAGARLAVAECQRQFRRERWNCPTGDRAPVFGYELTSGTKETAFIYAVMAAGLVHAITRACSHGNATACGCGLPEGGWQWGGCSDHVQDGTWFSRKFTDNAVKNTSRTRGGFTPLTVNRHNSEVGRQAISGTMALQCRCHGASGSCAVKTCWKSMAAFERIGAYLKERYERAVQVYRPRRKTRTSVDQQQLVYFNKSPSYCLEDRGRGLAGTRGRSCSRTSAGADGCNLLCCGRGYDTRVARRVRRCGCRFVWCCHVRCSRCESVNRIHTCK
ncbi:protein Wnt-16 [Brachionichthys hirsutus]|uniref:protein Wnt-16 n=1 Tax=Brachionichthys hirsutus TaxID=412623 RepID=UPI003604A686